MLLSPQLHNIFTAQYHYASHSTFATHTHARTHARTHAHTHAHTHTHTHTHRDLLHSPHFSIIASTGTYRRLYHQITELINCCSIRVVCLTECRLYGACDEMSTIGHIASGMWTVRNLSNEMSIPCDILSRILTVRNL